MYPTSRSEFKQKILRQLGAPVIDINVADIQIDDNIDMALQLYYDYNYDGTEKIYFRYQITQTDFDRKYIEVPENIIGITRVFPLTSVSTSSASLFDVTYQLISSDLLSMGSLQLAPYVTMQMNVAMIQEILNGQPMIRYNKNVNKLYIDIDWAKIGVGSWVIMEAYSVLDSEVYSDLWKDRWFTNYCVALVKKQWGNNLKKFNGLEMPGRITFNGQQIYNEAVGEIKELEYELKFSYANIPLDQIG